MACESFNAFNRTQKLLVRVRFSRMIFAEGVRVPQAVDFYFNFMSLVTEELFLWKTYG